MKWKLLAAAGAVFFALFILNAATLFYFRSQYNGNMNAASQEAWVLKTKVDAVEKELALCRETAAEASAKAKAGDGMTAELEASLSAANAKIDALAERVTILAAAIDAWQSRFDSLVEAVAGLKERMNAGVRRQ